MRFIRMTATFGKLKNQRLELGPGLNILEAPNEGGKSTWCAFLRAMLYGIPTRERDSKGFIAEKNRYQPWSGGAMEGMLELEWRGRSTTLRRGPKGSVPFGEFSAVYTGTAEAVPGLTAENCGETLLGMPRAVFERTVFVGQGGAAIGESAELECRIAALASSGEEGVSYSQAEAALTKWRNRRRSNVKNGLIPKLEAELEVINDTLLRQERSRRQAGQAQAELKELAERRDVLRDKLWAWRSRENVEKRRRWQEAQSALAAAQAEAEALETEAAGMPGREILRAAQGDLAYLNTLEANRKLAESQLPAAREAAETAAAAAADPVFSDMTPEQAELQAARDREEALRKPKKTPLWAVILLSLLAAGAGGLIVAGAVREIPLLFIIAAVLGALAGLGGIILGAVSLGRAKAQTARTAELLEKYGVGRGEDIPARAADYRARWEAAREAGQKAEAVERSARELAQQREELRSSLLELIHTFAPEVKDIFGISAAISRGLNLEERLSNARVRLEGAERLAAGLEKPEEESGAAPALPGAEPVDTKDLAAQVAALEGEMTRLRSTLDTARGELSTLGDPDLFEARRGELTEELAERKEEYEALTLAMEGLEAANNELQARFSPALNRAAGDILSALTGEKYHKVTLTREFEASAEERGGVLPRRALTLSQGTAEQLYLAVRLAICSLALPTGEDAPPLVLDDALDAFDDARCALALDYFRAAAAERQILLFTCHSREGVLARNAKVLQLDG